MEAETVNVQTTLSESNSLVSEGWKNLAIKNVQKAVTDFQQACSILSQKFSETSYECAESLFGYGSALLEQSRIENGVLGNALQGIADKAVGVESEAVEEEDIPGEDTFVEEDGTTAEEKEKISDEIIEAMVGDNDKEEAQLPETTAEVAPEEALGGEDVEKVTADDQESGESGEGTEEEDVEEPTENVETTETAEETTENAEEAAEVGTLQLAWEVLELARTIYAKEYEHLKEKVTESKELQEVQLKQADCLLKLGEVGVESETYDSAIEDYFKCRDLLKQAELVPDHRRFAEVSYQLGLAYGYKGLFDLAKLQYEEAFEVVEKRIKNCQNKLEEKTESVDVEELKQEIESLSSLLPDIKNKIEDCDEEIKNMKAEEESRLESGFGSEAVASSDAGDSSTNNITHLVRKKRKSGDGDLNDRKKIKLDEAADVSQSGEISADSEETTEPQA